jgi:hypothetical protein
MRKSDRWGVSCPAAAALGLFAALLAATAADDPRMGQLVVGHNTDGRL